MSNIARRKLVKIVSVLLCFLFIFQQSGFAQIAGELNIAGYLANMRGALPQDKFRPLHLRYISYDTEKNNFNILLDKGDTKNLGPLELRDETKDLLKYFLIGLALPSDSFWVNLRPDSPQDIIDPLLAQTDIGKVLLEADLQLKKDTARATSPQTPEGKDYWNKLYQKAEELFGSENITIPTLTRPWIVPDEIIIRESTDSAYVYKATLKVMLEQDYLKGDTVYDFKDERLKQLNEYSSQLIREIIIPKLTKEINSSKRYAALRQVYYSLILAQWFKARNQGKGSQYAMMVNRKDLTGLSANTPFSVDTYFNAYKENFAKGEYNIQEPANTPYGQAVRSYFSGGIIGISPAAMPSFGAPAVTDSRTGARIETVPAKTGWKQGIRKHLLSITAAFLLGVGPAAGNEVEIDLGVPSNENKVETVNLLNAEDNAKIVDQAIREHADVFHEQTVSIGTNSIRVYYIAGKKNIPSSATGSAYVGLPIITIDIPNSAALMSAFSQSNQVTDVRAQLDFQGMSQQEILEMIIGDVLFHETTHKNTEPFLSQFDKNKAFRKVISRVPFKQVVKDRSKLVKELAEDAPAGGWGMPQPCVLEDLIAETAGKLAQDEVSRRYLMLRFRANTALLTSEKEIRAQMEEVVRQEMPGWLGMAAHSKKPKYILYLMMGNIDYKGDGLFDMPLPMGYREASRALLEELCERLGYKTSLFTSSKYNSKAYYEFIRDKVTDKQIKQEAERLFKEMFGAEMLLPYDSINIPDEAIKKFREEFEKRQAPEPTGTHLVSTTPGSVTSESAIYGYNLFGKVVIDVEKSRVAFKDAVPQLSDADQHRVTGFVHAHEIFHLLAQKSGVSLNEIEEETLAETFAKEALGFDTNPGEEWLLNSFVTRINDPVVRKQIEELLLFSYDSANFLLTLTQMGVDIYNIEAENITSLPDGAKPMRRQTDDYALSREAALKTSLEERRFALAMASFAHGTNKATAAEEFLNKISSARMLLSELLSNEDIDDIRPQLEEINARLKEVLQRIIACKEEARRIRSGGSLTEGELARAKNEMYAVIAALQSLRGLLDQYRDRLESFVSRQEAAGEGGFSLVLRMIKGALSELEAIIADRILMMEGRRSNESVNLNELIASLREEIIIKDGNFPLITVFNLDIPGQTLTILGNRRSIISLLCNLSANGFDYALKNNPQNPRVNITLTRDGDEAVITVRDNGAGMTEKELSQVRGKIAVKSFFTTGGTGVGLAEAAFVAEDHGGRIEVASAVGAGTTFVVRLPLGQFGNEDITGKVSQGQKNRKASISSAGEWVGGIDFRTLPIVTQAVENLRAPMGAVSMGALRRINLSEEWGQIEQMVLGGITPSSERLKEFVQASCSQDNLDINKVVSCISDILRQQEETCCATEQILRDILVVLDSGKSDQELKEVFVGNI